MKHIIPSLIIAGAIGLIFLIISTGLKINRINEAERVNDSLRIVLHHVLTDWDLK